MKTLFLLFFIVICVIVAIVLFLAIRRKFKTKKKYISTVSIAVRNPQYFERDAED